MNRKMSAAELREEWSLTVTKLRGAASMEITIGDRKTSNTAVEFKCLKTVNKRKGS